MATSTKHRERSSRSKHKRIDFTDFYRKAQIKKVKKEQHTFVDTMKSVLHRTTNK